jgi:hypothetical protein
MWFRFSVLVLLMHSSWLNFIVDGSGTLLPGCIV